MKKSIMQDLAKLAAERLIYTLETPREVRREQRAQRRLQREPWTMRYFGMLPLSLHVWWSGRRNRRVKNEEVQEVSID